jgi:hypothetical protein
MISAPCKAGLLLYSYVIRIIDFLRFNMNLKNILIVLCTLNSMNILAMNPEENRFKENISTGNFRNAKLAGLDLQNDFRGVPKQPFLNIRKFVDLSGADLKGANLSNISFATDMVNLKGTDVSGAIFYDCTYSELVSQEQTYSREGNGYCEKKVCHTQPMSLERLQKLGAVWDKQFPPKVESGRNSITVKEW